MISMNKIALLSFTSHEQSLTVPLDKEIDDTLQLWEEQSKQTP